MTVQTVDKSPDAILRRIDSMAQELAVLKQMVGDMQAQTPRDDLAQHLFGSLGTGTWDEYDMDLDWQRFAV